MKKILFVANVDKEHILKFHVPSIKKFAENGWQVDVACAGNEDVPYITNRFVMKWKRNPISLNIFSEINKLKRIVSENEYDVVYCHTPTGGLAARLACRNLRKNGTKVVYFAHGFHFYKGAPLLNWLVYYPIEKKLSKITDLIITLNNEDFSFAKRHFCRKTRIILSNGVGVDLDRFSNANFESERAKYRNEFNIGADTVCLGYVAEIIKNKNQIMLLKCLKVLLNHNVNAKLILVGPDHSNGRFQKAIKRNKLEDKVVCTGWRNDANLMISAFDFCTPSSLREGLGLNLIEAMAKGIPVIANDNRGHRTIIDNGSNGVIVPRNNYKIMAKSLLCLLDEPMTKNMIINNALSSVDCFERGAVTEYLFEQICSVINNNNE